jgi:hypothetical protein
MILSCGGGAVSSAFFSLLFIYFSFFLLSGRRKKLQRLLPSGVEDGIEDDRERWRKTVESGGSALGGETDCFQFAVIPLQSKNAVDLKIGEPTRRERRSTLD